MTTRRSASAASTPIGSPSSRAQSRIRPASLSGSWIWLVWATRAAILRSTAVVMVEERDAGVADDLGRGALLPLAHGGELQRIGVGVLAAGVAARATDQPARGARVDPGGGRAGGTEVGIIGMAGDDHEPVGP